MAVLCTLGALSFFGLPKMRYPGVDVPQVTVTVALSGAAPTELEARVTRKVENGLAAVAGVRHLSSTVTEGLSTTKVEFRLEVNAQQALSDVSDAVAKVRGDLPSAIDEPVIQRRTVQDDAVVTYAVEAPWMTTEQLSWFIDDSLLGQVRGLQGVGRAERIGGVSREIDVDLDPDKMMALGVTAAEVNAQLSLTNLDSSGGKSRTDDSEQIIRTLSSAGSVADLAATRIVISGGRTIRLAELGSVVDHWQDPKGFARLDGVPIVGFAVYRSIGASDVSVGAAVDARIAASTLAQAGLRVRRIDDIIGTTTGNFEAAMRALYEGAALSVIVVFVFLRDWRATLIAGLALPLSVLPTFLAMSLMGFSLNIVTLLGITLATGILVDDAIVEIENIVRHLHMGKGPYRAAIEAADEIGPTVVAISATVIFIFAPVSFMPDVAGQYFKQFGLTIACAVFFSLLVARLITPMLAAFLMRSVASRLPRTARSSNDGFAMRLYTGLITATFARGMRWITLGFAVASLALAVRSMSALPKDFIPQGDDSRLLASVELPPGSTLEATSATIDQITRALHAVPEIVSVYAGGGASSSGSAEPRRADLVLRLTPGSARRRDKKALRTVVSQVLATIPDIRFSFDHQATVALVGPDETSVARGAENLVAAMREDALFVNPMALTSFAQPEVRIVPKADQPSMLGIAPSTIADTIRIATMGDSASKLAKFTTDGRQIPIMIQLDAQVRRDFRRIAMLQVPTTSGAVPLASLVDTVFGQGPASIERYDRQRLVTIGFEPAEGHTPGEGTDRIDALLATSHLPAGTHLQDSGDAELQSQMFSDFGTAMGVGIMLVFVVLILLSGNVFQPLTILMSLPLSAVGVVAALQLTRSAFSLPVVIGLLMLMGIVCKNAIMLIDTAALGVKGGMTRSEALIDAGRKRSRPIMMTTLAMVAGMVPAAFGVGVGGEFRAPMAIAVIGGLLASTILSLVLVPSLYTIMDDLSRLCGAAFRRALRPNRPEPDPGDLALSRFDIAPLGVEGPRADH